MATDGEPLFSEMPAAKIQKRFRMMMSHWLKSRAMFHAVLLLWACGVAFLVWSIGPRRELVDFVRPFLAACLVLCFIRLGAVSGNPLRQLSGLLAFLLPDLVFGVAFAAAYFLSIGHPVAAEDMEAMLQSYGAETLGFVKTIMFGPRKMAFALLLAAFTVLACYCAFFGAKVAQKTTWRQRFLAVALLCVAAGFVSQFKVTRLYFETRSEYFGKIEAFHQLNASLSAPSAPKPGRSTFQTIKECVFDYTCYHWDNLIYEKGKSYEENLARLNTLAGNIDRGTQLNSTQQQAGALYVLIIGESSGRDTLHAYGGPAKNTPWLDQFKDREDVLFFQNAYAPHTYTVAALTHALTDGRMATGATFPRGQNIIGVSKANDFHTVWISNQRMVGPFSTPIGALASTAHESFFTTGAYEGYNDDVPPDEAILPLLKSWLEKHDFSRNTLLVIHLIGSHIPYAARYPKDFPLIGELDRAHMGDAFATPKAFELFSTLATSQKYTDGILGEIFTLLETRRDKPIAAAYFSDHGEDPFSYVKYGVSGHDSKKAFDWSMSRIPFFMWHTPPFARLRPKKLAALKKRVDAPFTNDLIFDFYVGLSGIRADAYSSRFDLGSDDYAVTWENTFVTGKRFLSEDPNFIIKRNIERAKQIGVTVAVHRTNTIFKYRDASKYLRNFELDLMLMKDGQTQKTELMVGHNITHRADMSFRQYLSELPGGFDFLWLDIKNLNPKTSRMILAQLSELDKKFGLKKRVLIESPSAELLPVFSRNKWQTSLYITGNDINHIKDDVLKYKLKGVGWHVTTMDPSMLEKLKQVLPTDVTFYGWAAPEWCFSDPDLISKISKFSYLKTLLLTLESNFDIEGHAFDFDPESNPPLIPPKFQRQSD